MAKKPKGVNKNCANLECGIGFRTESGNKFCTACAKKMLRKMKADGYLTPPPTPTRYQNFRSSTDDDVSPSQENAIRFLEEGNTSG